MTNVKTAIIAGGGIGGLVSALQLHRAGVDVKVFESVSEIRALGVGINLLPHAVRVLTELGLEEKLEETGLPTRELIYANKFGSRIWQEDRGKHAGYKWSQYSIHRGRLQMLLLDAVKERLGEEAVRTGHHLGSFEETADGVTAKFVDKKTGNPLGEHSADVLIAADGIHSVVRRHFYPDEGLPKYGKRILWRAVTEGEPYLSGRSMIMAGHQNQKFVAYPIGPEEEARGRSLINWIAELWVDDMPEPADWNKAIDREKFASAFAGWDFGWLDVPELIEGAEAVYEFPMVDRDPLPQWSFGRVTLLGDAAHPMYPIGSNGASQAILDSEALRIAIEQQADAESVLKAYETERLGPTSQIVRTNRQNGPEVVMQMAEERAPEGFEHIEDVIPREELEAVANRYKQIAGFDKASLNQKAAVAND